MNCKNITLKKKFSASGIQTFVPTPSSGKQSAVGSRKNSAKEGAAKPKTAQRSPMASSGQAPSKQKPQMIQNVPATLSPKEMNSKVFTFKSNVSSPTSSR